MTNTTQTVQSGYAAVHGLQMYYEIHGTAHSGPPLVLLHGAFSAIGTSFGEMLPALAKRRKVIGFELQAHGRTADIDRPLTIEAMADDVAAALAQMGIDQADILGYNMGGRVASHAAIRHQEVVRKLVLMSVGYTLAGMHPGLMDNLGEMQPEMMHGSPWHDEYMRIAPRPEDFNRFFAKKAAMDRQFKDIPAETIRALQSPTLLIIGDSDLIRPEHAVEMFRLLGGGGFGDVFLGLPASQLAILPGTSHVSIVQRADWLVPMVNAFLDAPLPESQAEVSR
ncbi:MAG: alpha/beta hydrolase [Caldilinea sp. CFX5]|nr:alpha/beta hydrolase [Caldilinea sp. CFX5]